VRQLRHVRTVSAPPTLLPPRSTTEEAIKRFRGSACRCCFSIIPGAREAQATQVTRSLMLMRALRRRIPVAVAAVALAYGYVSSVASSRDSTGPSATATPRGTVLAWFAAINGKDARTARSYFAPDARYMMDWGPVSGWPRFTKLHCKTLSRRRAHAGVHCTFHESRSPSEGNPDTWWSIDLRRAGRRWLIENYGQP
jgi:hypothetical protein